jgi:hypothetical protein
MTGYDQHLRGRQVGEHRHVVIPQRPGRHLAAGVDPDLLEQRGTERLRHPAFHLPAQLYRVDDRPRVHGLHRLQDPDLAGWHVHRHPEPVGAEGHSAQGSVAEALGLKELGVAG